jgi:hypothetical protein
MPPASRLTDAGGLPSFSLPVVQRTLSHDAGRAEVGGQNDPQMTQISDDGFIF